MKIFNKVRFKLLYWVLKVISRGARIKLEERRLELGIFSIVSDLVFIMYFIHKSYRGGYAGMIKKYIIVKYVGNVTLFSYIG